MPPVRTSGGEVVFAGLSAPNVVVAVSYASRSLSDGPSFVPSVMMPVFVKVPEADGPARKVTVPFEPFGSVPMFQVIVPVAPIDGAVAGTGAERTAFAVAPLPPPPEKPIVGLLV